MGLRWIKSAGFEIRQSTCIKGSLGDSLYNGLYGEVPPERGTFRGYKRIISCQLAEQTHLMALSFDKQKGMGLNLPTKEAFMSHLSY